MSKLPLQAEAAEAVESLWSQVVSVWNQEILGFTAGQLVMATLIIAVGFVFRGLLARLFIAITNRIAKRTGMEMDDKLINAILGPAKLIPIIIAVFVSTRVLNLSPNAIDIANRVNQSLIAIAIFWGLRNAVTPLAHVASPLRRALTPEIMDWLFQGLRAVAVLLGAAVVLQIWGIPVAPIVAGFGIFGVAVALGAQDFFKNVIAGISILLEKRFQKGDWVLVDGVVEGNVEKIGFRSTHIRRFDKSPVYVPNTVLSDGAVTNFARMSHRRIKWVIGVEYRTTGAQLAEVQEKIENFIFSHDGFAQSPEVTTFVRVDAFNASSIDILVYAFTKTIKWVEHMDLKQELAFKIKEIVEEAGTAFAFPSTTMYLEKGDEPPQFFADADEAAGKGTVKSREKAGQDA